jgi:hypothetical protein
MKTLQNLKNLTLLTATFGILSVSTVMAESTGGSTSGLNVEILKLEVVDNAGKVVQSDVISEADPHLQYNMVTLPEGTYTIYVKIGDEVLSKSTVEKKIPHNVVELKIYQSNGKLVQQKKLNKNDMSYSLDNLPKGEYEIRIFNNGILVNSDIVKN